MTETAGATGEWGATDRLLARAETLAGAWGARARTSTTAGCERALLRLFGVAGLDRAGRPLAGEVVARYLAGGAGRLAGGVVLPFAAALMEYDLAPQALALEIAAGTIDLALEAEVLRDSGRRAAAEAEATRLAASALERIAANRTARRELLDLLGDAPRPWVGLPLAPSEIGEARSAIRDLVRDGADLVRIMVPPGRELADRLHDAGVEVPEWRSFEEIPPPGEPTPAGSQRGLASLRHVADEAAAERRSYVRLATLAPGLAAPEQAVVAAFERIDVTVADVVAEIVDGRVDPDRALADHAFAHRLHKRAGSLLVVGPGPLAVAPDLARGIPSDPATRAGRALALQLLGVAFARADGLAADQIGVGALPGWLLEERQPAARAIAEVTMRRALLPEHPLAFEEPAGASAAAVRWPFILAAVLPLAGSTALIVRDGTGPAPRQTSDARAAAAVAAEVAASSEVGALTGPALDHARATFAAAEATLDRLADTGWRAVLGQAIEGPPGERLGADAVVERSESFDPFGD
jgi:hypothetical protein